MATTVKIAEVCKMYYGRRRAKDTVKALERFPEIQARVYVFDSPLPPNQGGAINADAQIVILVKCPIERENEVRGMMALGVPEVGNFSSDSGLLAEQCQEFYQGSGLSRFRGQ